MSATADVSAKVLKRMLGIIRMIGIRFAVLAASFFVAGVLTGQTPAVCHAGPPFAMGLQADTLSVKTCLRLIHSDSTALAGLLQRSYTVTSPLIYLTGDPDAGVRADAIGVLDAIASERGSAAIKNAALPLLQDTVQAVRTAAVLALRRFSQPEVRLALQKLYVVDRTALARDGQTTYPVRVAIDQWFAIHGPWQQVFAHFSTRVIAAPSINESLTAGGRDSLALARSRFTALTGAVIAERDAMAAKLRPDSGTLRADSTFAGLRREYLAHASLAASDFASDRLIQTLACTDCALQQMRRVQLGEPRFVASVRDSILTDSLTRFVEAAGFHVAPDEGDVYVRPSESPLVAVAARFLTEPMRNYLQLAALESDETLGGDAAVSISWEDLGDRLASYDRLASKEPTFVLRDEAQKRAASLTPIFCGTDNSRLFDYRTQVMPVQSRRVFERYAERSGSLPTGVLAQKFLALLKQEGYRETSAVRAFEKELWDRLH